MSDDITPGDRFVPGWLPEPITLEVEKDDEHEWLTNVIIRMFGCVLLAMMLAIIFLIGFGTVELIQWIQGWV